MILINQVKLNINHNFMDLINKVSKITHIKKENIDIKKFKILKKSIDARDKNNILFVYNVAIDYDDSNKYNPIIKNISQKNENLNDDYLEKNFPKYNFDNKKNRPIVVGFGPAGIFASYIFAINGYRPIILERGKNIEDRIVDVNNFFENLQLNENSNVCFGEGGAGAFSDGKLNTNNKDKIGIYHFVLETFVKFGADENILYENLPHIGTDKLINIIKNIRNEILNLGGEINYNTKFTVSEYIKYANAGSPIILAIGNSSRDTFRDLIDNGFDLKPKPFAIGYRVAHKQNLINKSQYGDLLSNDEALKKLGPATYKLTYDVGNGHSVYSFCMCPGGYIINSSNFHNYLSINGMSYNNRNGKYANSAIVETIKPTDIKNFSNRNVDNPLLSIEFQEKIENKAFEISKGMIPFCKPQISQDDNLLSENIVEIDKDNIYKDNNDKDSIIKNIDENLIFKGKSIYCENLFDVYENLGLDFNINKDIKKALIHFNKIIKGFYDNDNDIDNDNEIIMAGVETRTSSPVVLARDENYMCNIKNFYPCGEGLGHGGGIMSCAVDGINVATKIIKNSLK